MSSSSSGIFSTKNFLWGALTVLLQLSYLALSHPVLFPSFELVLLFCTAAFLVNGEAWVKAFSDPGRLKIRDFAASIVIAGLLACLAGLEKSLASFLIWGVAIALQAKIFEYAYLMLIRRLPLNARVGFLVFATQIIVLFFLLGDAAYYAKNNLQFGTVTTAQNIHFGSILWMAFFYFFPAGLLFAFLKSPARAEDNFWLRLQREGDETFKRPFYLLLIVLLAVLVLLTMEMMRPHWGQLVVFGDESGYIGYARNIAGHETYLPTQPPLFTGLLGVLTIIFGDRPETALVLNFIMLIGTFGLLVYAAHALTKNLFFGVLAAMFFVGNRGTYLFSWTALTEPMNMFVLAASMASAAYLIQKKSLAAYAWFSIASVATVLLRSQNTVFSVLLIGFTFLYVYRQKETRPRASQLAVFLAVFFVPQLLWGFYRLIHTGHFNMSDGRGLYMFYGFNAPGNLQGMDSMTWSHSVDDWLKQNPHRPKIAMFFDAVKLRLQNPAETLSFWYWRLVELFNFRFIDQYGLKSNLLTNAQMLVLYGMFFLTLLRKPSRTHALTFLLWLGFYTSYIFIYAESRYRYPGDVILYVAITRCLYEIFALKPARLSIAVDAGYLHPFPQKPFYALSLGALALLALPHLTHIERHFPGSVPARHPPERTEKLALAGVTPVPLQQLTRANLPKLAGRLVTVPLAFEGIRFRTDSLYTANKEHIPDGIFNYAHIDGFELEIKEPKDTKIKKLALDTTGVYWGPEIKINQVYNATVLLLGRPAVKGPEGWTLMGYLIDLNPVEKK